MNPETPALLLGATLAGSGLMLAAVPITALGARLVESLLTQARRRRRTRHLRRLRRAR